MKKEVIDVLKSLGVAVIDFGSHGETYPHILRFIDKL
jgi:hypothetical protein